MATIKGLLLTRRSMLVLIMITLVLALLVFLAAYVTAESNCSTGGGVPYHCGQTYDQRDDVGDKAQGQSTADQQVWYIEAHIRTFNNDPFNSTGGWEMKASDYAYAQPGYLAITNWEYMGGMYNPSLYQCDVISPPIDCYATTYHGWVETQGGDNHSVYTSNDGQHSSLSCWFTPGC